MKYRVPNRPNSKNYYSFNEDEFNCLNYYCLFEKPKAEAYKLFLKPEVASSKTALKRYSEEFFASKEVIEYINDYKATLDSWLGAVRDNNKPKVSNDDKGREERKRKALEILADDLIDQIFALRDGDEGIDRETIIKMVDKIGWLDDEDIRVEAPRRYLPETCSQCEYKRWIEENCERIE